MEKDMLYFLTILGHFEVNMLNSCLQCEFSALLFTPEMWPNFYVVVLESHDTTQTAKTNSRTEE